MWSAVQVSKQPIAHNAIRHNNDTPNGRSHGVLQSSPKAGMFPVTFIGSPRGKHRGKERD